MPQTSPTGQPDSASAWFGSAAGQVLLDSERPAIAHAIAERPGQPWLWLAPVAAAQDADGCGRGLWLALDGDAWGGAVRCRWPLPLASESVGVIVLQHVAVPRSRGREMLAECARVLLPGGRLWLFALNPLAPYRWRWRGSGLVASEPLTWRRSLREVGLAPEPVSQGVGPLWQASAMSDLQPGPGLRAAYAIRAGKRVLPLTPSRKRAPLRLPEGVPAA